jgi:hypothetical protein
LQLALVVVVAGQDLRFLVVQGVLAGSQQEEQGEEAQLKLEQHLVLVELVAQDLQ